MRISHILFLTFFVSAAYQPLAHAGQNMVTIHAIGMNDDGQFFIAQSGDVLTNTPPQIQSDWNAISGLGQILNQPTLVSQFSNDSGYITNSALSPYATSTALSSGLSSKQNSITTGSASQYIRGDLSLAAFPAIPSVARTTSVLSLSLVGTGATGTQISSSKDSSISCCVSTSTTSTIGGPSTSVVAIKICATNNTTEGSWTTVAIFESDQTITLALALQSIQIVKGQLVSDVPAGWFAKLVNSGTGTHAEAFISGQQTIYG